MFLERPVKAFRLFAFAAALFITGSWVFSAVRETQVARLETITPAQIRAAAFAATDGLPVARHR
jgi:hypothetical protein